eukprot:g4098.t1
MSLFFFQFLFVFLTSWLSVSSSSPYIQWNSSSPSPSDDPSYSSSNNTEKQELASSLDIIPLGVSLSGHLDAASLFLPLGAAAAAMHAITNTKYSKSEALSEAQKIDLQFSLFSAAFESTLRAAHPLLQQNKFNCIKHRSGYRVPTIERNLLMDVISQIPTLGLDDASSSNRNRKEAVVCYLGDRVSGWFPNNSYYSAVIEAVHPENDSATLTWDDGDTRHRLVQKGRIVPLGNSTSEPCKVLVGSARPKITAIEANGLWSRLQRNTANGGNVNYIRMTDSVLRYAARWPFDDSNASPPAITDDNEREAALRFATAFQQVLDQFTTENTRSQLQVIFATLATDNKNKPDSVQKLAVNFARHLIDSLQGNPTLLQSQEWPNKGDQSSVQKGHILPVLVASLASTGVLQSLGNPLISLAQLKPMENMKDVSAAATKLLLENFIRGTVKSIANSGTINGNSIDALIAIRSVTTSLQALPIAVAETVQFVPPRVTGGGHPTLVCPNQPSSVSLPIEPWKDEGAVWRRNAVRDLQLWLLTKGAYINSKVNIQMSKDDRHGVDGGQVTALSNLTVGERIATIPLKLLLTTKRAEEESKWTSLLNAWKAKMPPPKASELESLRNGHVLNTMFERLRIIIYLMESRHDPKSSFFPYASVLPRSVAHLPQNFPPEAQLILEESSMASKRDKDVELITAVWQCLTANNALSELKKEYTKSEFFWAYSIVQSRSFGLPILGQESEGSGGSRTRPSNRCGGRGVSTVMVPFADMINHATRPNTAWTWNDSEKAFTLTMTSNLLAGQQVTDSYGIQANSHYFAHYGFVIDGEHAGESSTVTVTEEDLLLRSSDMWAGSRERGAAIGWGNYDVASRPTMGTHGFGPIHIPGSRSRVAYVRPEGMKLMRNERNDRTLVSRGFGVIENTNRKENFTHEAGPAYGFVRGYELMSNPDGNANNHRSIWTGRPSVSVRCGVLARQLDYAQKGLHGATKFSTLGILDDPTTESVQSNFLKEPVTGVAIDGAAGGCGPPDGLAVVLGALAEDLERKPFEVMYTYEDVLSLVKKDQGMYKQVGEVAAGSSSPSKNNNEADMICEKSAWYQAVASVEKFLSSGFSFGGIQFGGNKKKQESEQCVAESSETKQALNLLTSDMKLQKEAERKQMKSEKRMDRRKRFLKAVSQKPSEAAKFSVTMESSPFSDNAKRFMESVRIKKEWGMKAHSIVRSKRFKVIMRGQVCRSAADLAERKELVDWDSSPDFGRNASCSFYTLSDSGVIRNIRDILLEVEKMKKDKKVESKMKEVSLHEKFSHLLDGLDINSTEISEQYVRSSIGFDLWAMRIFSSILRRRLAQLRTAFHFAKRQHELGVRILKENEKTLSVDSNVFDKETKRKKPVWETFGSGENARNVARLLLGEIRTMGMFMRAVDNAAVLLREAIAEECPARSIMSKTELTEAKSVLWLGKKVYLYPAGTKLPAKQNDLAQPEELSEKYRVRSVEEALEDIERAKRSNREIKSKLQRERALRQKARSRNAFQGDFYRLEAPGFAGWNIRDSPSLKSSVRMVVGNGHVVRAREDVPRWLRLAQGGWVLLRDEKSGQGWVKDPNARPSFDEEKSLLGTVLTKKVVKKPTSQNREMGVIFQVHAKPYPNMLVDVMNSNGAMIESNVPLSRIEVREEE